MQHVNTKPEHFIGWLYGRYNRTMNFAHEGQDGSNTPVKLAFLHEMYAREPPSGLCSVLRELGIN